MNEIISKLKVGDLRSVGYVPEIVERVLETPELFSQLVGCMVHENPGVRMRSSDAVEKISRVHPEYLQPHKEYFLTEVINQNQQEVRWHLAQIIPRLELSDEEKKRAIHTLFNFIEDSSRIVQANTLQALVELAWEDKRLFQKVKRVVEDFAETGSPAVRNKARKLLQKMVRKVL